MLQVLATGELSGKRKVEFYYDPTLVKYNFVVTTFKSDGKIEGCITFGNPGVAIQKFYEIVWANFEEEGLK